MKLPLNLLLFVSALFISNTIYTSVQIFQPIPSETPYLPFPHEIITLLINSILVISIFYLLYSYRKKHQQIETDKLKLIQEKVITNNLPLYTDSLLIENFPNLLCIKDSGGRWIKASTEYLTYLDMRYVDYVGKTDAYLALHSKSNSGIFKENIEQDRKAWELKKNVQNNVSFVQKDDSIRFDILTTPIFDENNNPFRLLVTGQQQRQDQKRIQELALFSNIFSSSHLSFIILDVSFKITSANSAFSILFGYTFDEINNQPISFLTDTNQQELCNTIQTYFDTNHHQLWSEEIKCKKKNGKKILIKLEIKPIQSKDKTFDNYFVTLEDITLFKENENRILQIAHYDHLTGLVNRAMFMERMAQFLSAAQRYNLTAVVFFIDLDKFKLINDEFGHVIGDKVLRQFSELLQESVREVDLVSRYGGEEFVLLLRGVGIETAEIVLERIRISVEQLKFSEQSLAMTISVGITEYIALETAEETLDRADKLLYVAKQKGRNRVVCEDKPSNLAVSD